MSLGTAIGDLLECSAISQSADTLFHALRGQYHDLLRWPKSGALTVRQGHGVDVLSYLFR